MKRGLKITPPKNSEEFQIFLKDQWDETSELKNEISKDLTEKRIVGIRNKRKFLQDIVVASITLLGFISAFSVINPGGFSDINRTYFIIGVCTFLFLIFFVFTFLREVLDKEIEGLMKSQDDFTFTLESKIRLVEKYIIILLENKMLFSQELMKNYYNELKELPEIQKVIADNKKLDIERENRMSKKTELEFSGEIVVFTFVCGAILIFISMLQITIPIKYLLLALLLVFYFTFTDSLEKFLKPIFKIMKYITRKDLLK